jgi:hypothetical protein
MAPIISMMIVRLAIVVIELVALMVVAIFMMTTLPVAQFTATCCRKMSRFLLFWLLLVLGNLLKIASRLVGCLTLLKESNQLGQVSRHHLVPDHKLKSMRLGLREEDLVTFLLHPGYFHCLMELAILKVAEKLYSMPHELVHWDDSGLLGRTKPENQLVANIWKTGNGLKIILDEFVEVCLITICLVWTLIHNDAGPLGQAYVLKH